MSDKPVMHGRDHRPGGMDPIPATALQALGLPSAVFTKTIGSPITDPATAGELSYDTVQTPNPEFFSIVSSDATLLTGFYLCQGYVQLASATDWHAQGPTAQAVIGSASAGAVNIMRDGTTISIAANPSYLNELVVTSFLLVGGATAVLRGGFGTDGVSTLISGVAIANAVVVRISGEYSISI